MLSQREVKEGSRIFNGLVVFRVSCDTDNLHLAVVDLKRAPEQIHVWRQPPCESLVDDPAVRRAAPIAFIDAAAAEDGNVHRPEVTCADTAHVCAAFQRSP